MVIERGSLLDSQSAHHGKAGAIDKLSQKLMRAA